MEIKLFYNIYTKFTNKMFENKKMEKYWQWFFEVTLVEMTISIKVLIPIDAK